MRLHEECPKCGYVEEDNWRPALMMTDADILEDNELPSTFLNQIPVRKPTKIGQWVYYRPKDSRWVYRKLWFIYECEGWRANYQRGGHKSKGRRNYRIWVNRRYGRKKIKQMKLIEVE